MEKNTQRKSRQDVHTYTDEEHDAHPKIDRIEVDDIEVDLEAKKNDPKIEKNLSDEICHVNYYLSDGTSIDITYENQKLETVKYEHNNLYIDLSFENTICKSYASFVKDSDLTVEQYDIDKDGNKINHCFHMGRKDVIDAKELAEMAPQIIAMFNHSMRTISGDQGFDIVDTLTNLAKNQRR